MGYELKTKVNNADVITFINSIEEKQKKEDCFTLLEIFEHISGNKGKMWGKKIIGFGNYHYVYSSGQEGDWMRTGFAPRAQGLSLYIMPGYQFGNMQELLSQLGKYKSGKSCINIKKISDINVSILKQIIQLGLDDMQKRYPK